MSKVKRGDWIRWRAMDGLLIGEVVYVRDSPSYPYHEQAITERGTVGLEEILEVRAAPAEETSR